MAAKTAFQDQLARAAGVRFSGGQRSFHLPFGYLVGEGLRGDRAAFDGLMEEPGVVERLLGCSNRCERRFDKLHRFASQIRITLDSPRLTPPRWTPARAAFGHNRPQSSHWARPALNI